MTPPIARAAFSVAGCISKKVFSRRFRLTHLLPVSLDIAALVLAPCAEHSENLPCHRRRLVPMRLTFVAVLCDTSRHLSAAPVMSGPVTEHGRIPPLQHAFFLVDAGKLEAGL
jgi:hypothetical protein